ncbi:MAG: hypothetical protein WC788_08705 [Candidatus Paceibacterota bacterium]|jgi:hypothetical protein
MTIEASEKKIIAIMGFIVFAVIVNESSNYLIEMVPPPQLAPVDLFSILHAFAAGGFAFFAVMLADEGSGTKRNIYFLIIFLVVAWEVVENTVLKGTPISGGESLLNSGADIIIGMAMSGMVLFGDRFRLKPKNNIKMPRSNFS